MKSLKSAKPKKPVSAGLQQARSKFANETSFKPGDPRINREGRIEGSKNKKTVFTDALLVLVDEIIEGDGRTYAQAMVKRIMLSALQGREKSAEMLWDRMEGKPTQPIQHGFGIGNQPLNNKAKKRVDEVEEEIMAILGQPQSYADGE